jgi:hypothetical protein
MPPLPAQTLAIREPLPLGSVTLAPTMMTGRSEAELARAMAESLFENATSTSEALRELRQAFPDSPLAMRVGALAALRRR